MIFNFLLCLSNNNVLCLHPCTNQYVQNCVQWMVVGTLLYCTTVHRTLADMTQWMGHHHHHQTNNTEIHHTCYQTVNKEVAYQMTMFIQWIIMLKEDSMVVEAGPRKVIWFSVKVIESITTKTIMNEILNRCLGF